jgi:zinc transport system ATP-binding protein
VIDDVSLQVPAGSFLALVGANGSGKSTLMRLGLGLLRPTSGSVRLFGADASRFSQRWQIGYVPQRASAATRSRSASWRSCGAGWPVSCAPGGGTRPVTSSAWSTCST